MPINKEQYLTLKKLLDTSHSSLIAVSKMQTVESIRELYDLGHRDFGENYVQELLAKAESLPGDIRWHFIGHLQSNKVKQILGIVQLIQGVDSLKLLTEINRQAEKKGMIQDCLLQVHIAREETKFGLDEQELKRILETDASVFRNVRIRGLMGMASLTADEKQVADEFEFLAGLYKSIRGGGRKDFDILSMGMSGDYSLALKAGSNMVRIGSLLFGSRR